MADMIDKLQFYFQFQFVRNVLIVGALIAVCAALLGVTLVLRHFSYIGDGLSHVAFGVMCVASVLDLADANALVMPITVLAAILLLRTGQNTKVKGDAAIAMISVSSLALGYMLMNIYGAKTNLTGDVCSTLFGSTSILTIKSKDVYMCLALFVIVVSIFVIFYRKIFAVTFDEDFARATGVKVNLYNNLLATIIAVVIVMAMNLVGSLLISALIIFPALSAMRIFKSFLKVTICSVVVSLVCAIIGILVSILAGTPVGPTIVTADMAVYFLFALAGGIKGRVA